MGSNMSTLKEIAILGLACSAVASPVNLSSRSTNVATSYQAYRGDGSVARGWPSKDQWIPFEDMWNLNYPELLTQNAGHENEIPLIQAAISQVAASTGIDARFILAMVMQESSGNIRAETTSFGLSGPNPGLLQAHGGPSCKGKAICTYEDIHGMIMQGAVNGADGINIHNFLQRSSGKGDPADYYWAARYYNSGPYSMLPGCRDNLSCYLSGATPSYASDIANRLRGLTDATGARGGGNINLFQGEAC